jgi:hypothetical protein
MRTGALETVKLVREGEERAEHRSLGGIAVHHAGNIIMADAR